MKITENKVPTLNTTGMAYKARKIRDAVVARSVTTEEVGSLFVDLIDACGNMRDALALFLDTNVPEITENIDRRLAGVDDATSTARGEIQRMQATRALVEELVGLLSSQNVTAPTRVEVTSYPHTVTMGNQQRPQIEAKALPAFGIGSLLFIGDNQVLEVTPDGRITPLKEGVGHVHVVATTNTKIYKTLTVAVVAPRMRMTGAGLRLDKNGNIRLT